MKDGLSGSVINEMEVNDRWSEMQQQARKNLDRLKSLEKNNPKPYVKNGIGYHTEGFRALAKEIMSNRCKERYLRKE